MADEKQTHDPLTDDQFAAVKMYCKVDQTFEDDMLQIMVDDATSMIANAVKTGSTAADYLGDPRLAHRFLLAAMKVVKENYDYRGEGAEIMRYQLLEPIAGTINQLRTEVDDSADEQR